MRCFSRDLWPLWGQRAPAVLIAVASTSSYCSITDNFTVDAGVTYVSPQRTIKNVDRLPPTGPGQLPDTLGVTPSIDVEGDYSVPRVGFKFNVVDPVDCLATYTEPFGAVAEFGHGQRLLAALLSNSASTPRILG